MTMLDSYGNRAMSAASASASASAAVKRRGDAASFPQKPVAQLLGSNGPIHAVTYSASPGTYILTGSADRSIPGRLIQTYTSHSYDVLSLAISADNARFASSGGDRAVFLWDVATAATTRRFAGHAGRVNAVAFAGAGDALVVSAGLDTTVRVWDTRSGGGSSAKPVQTLAEARDAVTSLAVTSDEIVAGSVDGRVRSYDVRTGKVTTDVMPASVTSLCLGRDGRTVLVGSLDSRVRLMDRGGGGCLRTNEGNQGRVWAWDLLSGRLVAKVAVPWGPATGNDGRRKMVIGRDGKEKERKNVISCLAWKEGGFGNQFCVGGTSGVVTVFGEG
ncbi:WD40-repeat-containing domain protein [Bombardia bombarda]|uniref:WD40-repeat-containing domain protein n=1 Tax=Bombardia bombarda TaxID=252184 RepID=A0AA39WIC5_9PEZI|nr:WD40-repeat-containing domain protein [Bombardia bombarda]